MRLILDTHVFFWWVSANRKLSRTAIRLIEDGDNEVLVSAVVAWELSIKSQSGKWSEVIAVLDELDEVIAASGFRPLPIRIDHARRAGRLSGSNRDPFDRMLATQAQIEDAFLISADRRIGGLGAQVIW